LACQLYVGILNTLQTGHQTGNHFQVMKRVSCYSDETTGCTSRETGFSLWKGLRSSPLPLYRDWLLGQAYPAGDMVEP